LAFFFLNRARVEIFDDYFLQWLCYNSDACSAGLRSRVFEMRTSADIISASLGTELRMSDTPIRVLVAKPGLDGHDRGAKVVARALRDAGMEVIYTGIRQTPEMIAEAAVQEDVDVVGLSILSGAHLELFPRVTELLKAKGKDDVLLVAGGIVPDEDIPRLNALGFAGVFGPGTNTHDLVKFVQEKMAEQRIKDKG
jgi:methylmalonyl-CoA mutase C-terminal domain/subunit